MRNTVVRHFGHTPLVAGRLFFITTCFGFWISTFFLHFTQYACAIVQTLLSIHYCAEAITYVDMRQYTLPDICHEHMPRVLPEKPHRVSFEIVSSS
jgi:hypothetical protein